MKKLHLYLLLLLPCLWASTASYAQLTLTGKVVDAQQAPLVSATLSLNIKDSTKTYKYALSDTAGRFTFEVPANTYTLTVNYVGIAPFSKEVFLRDSNVNIGTLVTAESDSKTLKGVTVTAKKPLIEQKIDRLVFNVENSIASQGTDALSALASTPLVKVDEINGISLVGKGGVAVMVNDRLLNLSGDELMNYLRSIRSDNIAKIEVITTPPSKYEAQGNSGLINIILKTNSKLGWSGNISSGVSQRSHSTGYNNGFNLNYQDEKLSVSLNLTQMSAPMQAIYYQNIFGQKSFFSNYIANLTNMGLGGTIKADYKIGKRANIGLSFNADDTKYKSNKDVNLSYLTDARIDSTLTTHTYLHGDKKSTTSSLYYDLDLDDKGKKMSLTANYFKSSPQTDFDFNTHNQTTDKYYQITTANQLSYSVASGQLDFTLPYTWANLETGAKFTNFQNNSGLQYYDMINANAVLNTANSNDFDYREQNYAAYISGTKDFNKQWSGKLGLRYEYSAVRGFSPTLRQTSNKEYDNFFPTAYLAYNPNGNHSFSFSYSRRIGRPDFNALNPFRNYTSPYSYTEGNPTLQPSYSNNLDLKYTFKNKLSFTLYGQEIHNIYGLIPTLVNGYQISRQENISNTKLLGLFIFYSDNFFKFWDMNSTFNSGYAISATKIPGAVAQKGFTNDFSISNTFGLNAAKTLNLLVNYTHFFGNRLGNAQNLAVENFTAGVKSNLLHKTLQISAVVTDAFRQQNYQGKTYFATYYQTYGNYTDNRRFNLSVSYSFGNNKVKGVNKEIEFEDKSRAN